jgi:hypothetical protein
VHGQEIILRDGQNRYMLVDTVEYYCDASQQLTIKEISSLAFSRNFKKSVIPKTGDHSRENYWVRIKIINRRSDENQAWYFESWSFDYDDIEFYVPNGKGFIKTSMGYHKDFSERNIFHKNFSFHINLRPGEEATYYIKLRSSHPISFFSCIRIHEAFMIHALYEY